MALGFVFPPFLDNLHVLSDVKHEEKRFAWQQRTVVAQWETDGIQTAEIISLQL